MIRCAATRGNAVMVLRVSSALVRLQAWLDGLVVQELLQAFLAALLRITVVRLVRLGVQVIFALLPSQFAGALEALLGITQYYRILFEQVLRQSDYRVAQLLL